MAAAYQRCVIGQVPHDAAPTATSLRDVLITLGLMLAYVAPPTAAAAEGQVFQDDGGQVFVNDDGQVNSDG